MLVLNSGSISTIIMPEKFPNRGSAELFSQKAEVHKNCHHSRYVYANTINFGEHDLHNISHNLVFNTWSTVDHNQHHYKIHYATTLLKHITLLKE
jgi:hypothetical protein